MLVWADGGGVAVCGVGGAGWLAVAVFAGKAFTCDSTLLDGRKACIEMTTNSRRGMIKAAAFENCYTGCIGTRVLALLNVLICRDDFSAHCDTLL